MKYYVVRYSGPFGFIKPWTAVGDGETFSQQFLTPSIVEGIEKKIFPDLLEEGGTIKKILRHRLSYSSISMQKEQTQARGWNKKKNGEIREKSILDRGVMINPVLHLAFGNEEEAKEAVKQHICLCRNEDILIPGPEIMVLEEEEFNALDGYELHFEKAANSFLVGYNRFDGAKPMYGWLEICGRPVFDMI